MFINAEELTTIFKEYNIQINGVLHIGAHNCEELSIYDTLGIKGDKIIWIDAIQEKVDEAKSRGIQNIYHAVVTDTDDDMILFNIANNYQSSSVLELGTHEQEYPSVKYVKKILQSTITVDTFCERNNIDISKYDFWNFDIQGAELIALKGATKSLPHVKALYLEVNIKELYKDCGLMDDVNKFLEPFGFKPVIAKMTTSGWGDALYIRCSM